jgi:hypothetical protein
VVTENVTQCVGNALAMLLPILFEAQTFAMHTAMLRLLRMSSASGGADVTFDAAHFSLSALSHHKGRHADWAFTFVLLLQYAHTSVLHSRWCCLPYFQLLYRKAVAEAGLNKSSVEGTRHPALLTSEQVAQADQGMMIFLQCRADLSCVSLCITVIMPCSLLSSLVNSDLSSISGAGCTDRRRCSSVCCL